MVHSTLSTDHQDDTLYGDSLGAGQVTLS